jgi:membrane protein DedA with SNARE-associated domain
MELSGIWEAVLEFVRNHEAYLLPIAFLICMAESVIVVSLFVPSTIILLASSTLLGASGVGIAALWVAAGLGAALGDWVSYGLGRFSYREFKDGWPFYQNRRTVARGRLFFAQWGWASMFLARFMGPLRSFTPLVAGICRMPLLPFGLASLASAFVWAAAVLAPTGIGAGFLLGR